MNSQAKRIGVLRGGISPEYHISLQTGAEVQRALADAGFEAVDMLLDRDGVLHIKGIPSDLEKAKESVDLVWNALHGTFGEDGSVQQIFETYGIPFTGSTAETARKAFDKAEAKRIAASLGISTPASMLFMPHDEDSVSEIAQRIYRTMAPPWVVKPLHGGGSAHAHFAFTALDLAHVVEESVARNEPFLVEQYIFGREAAVGTIDQFRGAAPYVLPVVEVSSAYCGILGHETRGNRNSTDSYARLRGGFTDEERKRVSLLAVKLHEAFGITDYGQSEFIVDKRGVPWFIETDTHPHLHKDAPFAIALDAVGSSLKELARSMVQRRAGL